MKTTKMIYSLFTIMIVLFSVGISTATVTDTASPIVSVTLLNQAPDPAGAGDVFDARFQITNAGSNAAEGVTLTLENSYPFSSADGNAVQNIGSVSGGETGLNFMSTTFHVKVDKDAIAGTYDLKLNYHSNDGTTSELVFPIRIENTNFAQAIYLNTSKLEPGQETPVTFTITNTGQSALQNLVFSWSEPNGVILPVHSDNTKYVKYLDIGKSVDLDYTMVADVNTPAGLYALNLNLGYQTANTSQSGNITTKTGMSVGGTTDFDVAFSESANGQTSLSVANIGNNQALSVSVIIPNQEGYRVSGSPDAIVGNLDKGDYTIVSFPITQTGGGIGNYNDTTGTNGGTGTRTFNRTGNAGFGGAGALNYNGTGFNRGINSSQNNLQVIVEYTDTTGIRQSVQKDVTIQFRGAATDTGATTGTATAAGTAGGRAGFGTSTKSNTSTIIIILLVLVAAGGWYFYYRAQKKSMTDKKNR